MRFSAVLGRTLRAGDDGAVLLPLLAIARTGLRAVIGAAFDTGPEAMDFELCAWIVTETRPLDFLAAGTGRLAVCILPPSVLRSCRTGRDFGADNGLVVLCPATDFEKEGTAGFRGPVDREGLLRKLSSTLLSPGALE